MKNLYKNSTASRISVQTLCMTGLFTSIMVIMAPISIPLPLGVPMTLQTFTITFAAIVLGAKYGCFSTLIYLLLGMIGLPVFSNFTGGISCLLGPTGGFLMSFPIMAYLIGLGADLRHLFKGALPFFVILGTAVNYLIGTAVFCALTGSQVAVGISACVIPFIPTAVIKAVLAVVLGLSIRKRIPAILLINKHSND